MKFRTNCPHQGRCRKSKKAASELRLKPQSAMPRPEAASASAALRFRVHLDNPHHAQVFMIEDVTVIDEVSDIYPAEVHE